MNAELDAVFQSMVIGAVPALWKSKSFPSLKSLGSYSADLFRRLQMLTDWYVPFLTSIALLIVKSLGQQFAGEPSKNGSTKEQREPLKRCFVFPHHGMT
jgi:dynein heavy chain